MLLLWANRESSLYWLSVSAITGSWQGEDLVEAFDIQSSTLFYLGRKQEARSVTPCSGSLRSLLELGQRQSQHLGFQPSNFLDNKIDVNNWIEVQDPIKQTVANKLRNEGPEHGHEKCLC